MHGLALQRSYAWFSPGRENAWFSPTKNDCVICNHNEWFGALIPANETVFFEMPGSALHYFYKLAWINYGLTMHYP